MIVRYAIRQARERLSKEDIPDARIEAESLLAHILQKKGAGLYLDMDKELRPEQESALASLMSRRLHHEPLAYILGEWEFYGMKLQVDSRVLVPRPETELLVERTLKYLKSRFHTLHCPCIIADVGTGCGAITIALARSLLNSKVYAIDISSAALEVTRANCERHNVSDRVHILEGDLLSPLPEPVDVIVANLPYVRSADLLNLCPEIRDFEPPIALRGGEDGLFYVRRLLREAWGKLREDGAIVMEIGFDQAQKSSMLARKAFPVARIEVFPDLSGIDRVIMVSEIHRGQHA